MFAANGWLVGRMTSVAPAGLVAFAATIFVWSLSSGIVRFAAPASTGLVWYAPHGRAVFLVELATYMAFVSVLLPMTTLVAGLLSVRPRS
jgi:hypothetical protein